MSTKKEVTMLRAALRAIDDEAVKHHEYNPVSNKFRLPKGYMNILMIVKLALNKATTK